MIIVIFSLKTLDERLPLSSSVLLKCMEMNCLEIEHGVEIGQKEALNNNKTLPTPEKKNQKERKKISLHDSCTDNVKLAVHSQQLPNLCLTL